MKAKISKEDFPYSFKNENLFKQAMTHVSASSQHSNERLEFLGDRVLGLGVASLLWSVFPKETEGSMAKRQAALVSRKTLALVANNLKLNDFLLLSRTEDLRGGRKNNALLADACEALLGAIYLDGGFEAALTFIEKYWAPFLIAGSAPPQDAKTALQEFLQEKGWPLPQYRLITKEGPDHFPLFCIELSQIGPLPPLQAQGKSKREAEQEVAKKVLERLKATK